jgi:hypothetical protein
MATNSTISVKLQDGSISQVFCHWDGDLTTNGKILFERYDNQTIVEELISKGNLSSLGKTIDESEFRTRDMGDSWFLNKPNHFDSIESYKQFMISNGQQFNYLFDGDEWKVSERSSCFSYLSVALLFADLL